MRLRWPSCSAPIVGTRPMTRSARRAGRSAARSVGDGPHRPHAAATARVASASDVVEPEQLGRALGDGLAVARHGRLVAADDRAGQRGVALDGPAPRPPRARAARAARARRPPWPPRARPPTRASRGSSRPSTRRRGRRRGPRRRSRRARMPERDGQARGRRRARAASCRAIAQPAPAKAPPARVTVMSGCRPKASCGREHVEARGARAVADAAGRARSARRGGRDLGVGDAEQHDVGARAGVAAAVRSRRPAGRRPGRGQGGRPPTMAIVSVASDVGSSPRIGVPVTCDVHKAYPVGPTELRRLRLLARARPQLCLRLDRAAFEAGAPGGAQGRLPPGAGLHPLPSARRDPHHRRLRLGQRRRRPDVRRRGAGRATRTSRGCRSSGRPASCWTQLLGEIGLHARRRVHRATSLKCRPPGNRDPHPEEIENCHDYLLRQVELIEPRVICTLGNFATKLLRARPDRDHAPARARRRCASSGTRAVRLYPDLPSRRRRSTRRPTSRCCGPTSPGCPSCWRWRRRRSPAGRRSAPAAARARAALPDDARARARRRGGRRPPDGAVLMVHPSAATGFARSVEAYERARPEYPPEAIAWLAEALGLRPGRTVVDLAAGSGKLTRPLAALGCEVIAIEPVAEMRAAIGPTRAAPLDGTAEAMPLPDDSADAVTVGQAFHWFDGPEALAEIERVLRPGGALALVWNRRPSESSALHAAISEIIAPVSRRRARPRQRRLARGLRRTRADRAPTSTFTQRLDADALADRVGSTSFVAALDDAQRAAAARARARARCRRAGRRPVRVRDPPLARLDVIDRGAEHRAGDARLRPRSRAGRRPAAGALRGGLPERRHLRVPAGARAARRGRSPSCACWWPTSRAGGWPWPRRRAAGAAAARRWRCPPRGTIVVGRSRGCDVVMRQPTVSRRHLELRALDGAWLAVDLGLSNGTWLWGGASAARACVPGDELVLGDCAVVLEARRAPAPSGVAQERVARGRARVEHAPPVARRAHQPGAAQDAQVLVDAGRRGAEAPREVARRRRRAERREDRRAAAAEQGRERLAVAAAAGRGPQRPQPARRVDPARAATARRTSRRPAARRRRRVRAAGRGRAAPPPARRGDRPRARRRASGPGGGGPRRPRSRRPRSGAARGAGCRLSSAARISGHHGAIARSK